VEAWDPWLAWARARYDVHFETTAGIIHQPQPAATLIRLGEAVAALDAFRLAGLSPVVTITGSLILALALIDGAGDPDTLWTAANVDEDFQAEMWGVDALAAQALANKRGEFDAAVRFLHALD
jgi:chaperone required for assembly of F1-ATPase